MKKLLLIILTFFASTQIMADARPQETLIGYIRLQEAMVFQVYSGGCTQKEDFELIIEQRREKIYLTLYRVNPDFCKARMPFGTYISFTYEELGLSNRETFQITNPLNPGFIF